MKKEKKINIELKINIKGKEIVLNEKDSKELYEKLKEYFSSDSTSTIIYKWWYDYYPKKLEPYCSDQSYTVWCSNDNTAQLRVAGVG